LKKWNYNKKEEFRLDKLGLMIMRN